MTERDTVEYRIAEITRGYLTGEYSNPTRDHSGLRMTDSEPASVQSGTTPPADIGGATPTPWAYEQACNALWRHRDRVALYAKRNGELHVLLRLMHNALKAADPDNPLLVQAEEILCDVPNQRVGHEG